MNKAHQVVATYWAAAERRDWDTSAGLIAERVVYQAPQFQEQVRGCSCSSEPPVKSQPRKPGRQ
jgi:hypothetical protein